MQNNTFSTLFVSQNLIKLKEVDSTNTFLKNLASNSEPLPEGTVILAEHQYAGRGQQGNIWQAEPGKNLTFSLFLKPTFLSIHQQFYLNIAISLAIIEALEDMLPRGLKIKWPNDIYFKNRKLGGILIENSVAGQIIKSSVIGIGLNINQNVFDELIKEKATSVSLILQHDVCLNDIFAVLCKYLEVYYLKLKAGKLRILQENYINKLYKHNILALYRQNGEVFEGRLKGITNEGVLIVLKNNIEEKYNFKEIEFITN